MLLILPPAQMPRMTRHTILMRLDRPGLPRIYSQRHKARAHDLHKVHEIERPMGGKLRRAIERVLRHLLAYRQIRAKAQLMDKMRETMLLGGFVILLEIVHMHVCVGERLAGCDVEVPRDFVDRDVALDVAPFIAHLGEVLGVVLLLTLLDAGSVAPCPADGLVGFAHIVAGVAAAVLLQRGGAVAWAAVFRIQVLRDIVLKAGNGIRKSRLVNTLSVSLSC